MKWIVCILLGFIIFGVNCKVYAQNQAHIPHDLSIRIDSLENLIYVTEKGISQIDLLNQLAELRLNSSPELAFKNSLDALKESRKRNYLLGIARSCQNIGLYFFNQGNYPQSIKYYLNAIRIYQSNFDWQGLAKTYNLLGRAFYYSTRINDAFDNYQKSLKIYQEQKNLPGQAETYGYIGHVFEKKSDYKQALAYQNKALKIYQNLRDESGVALIYENIGSVYEDLADYEKAHAYFLKSYQYNKKNNNLTAMINDYNNLGDVFRKRNDFKQALVYTFQSYELGKKLKNKYQTRSALKDLAKTYALMEDYTLAHQYLDASYELYQEIYTEESALKIAQMQTFYETQEKEKEIEILAQKNLFNTILTYFFVSGIAILLILGWIIFAQQRIKIRKNRELIERNQKIYETEHELTQVELQNAQLKEQQLVLELESRNKELTTRALHIIQKNEVLLDLKDKLDQIQNNSQSHLKEIHQLQNLISYSFALDKDWDDFKKIFEQVHKDFFNKLQEKVPDLTSGELKLCALFKLNLNSQDMATILGISQDSLRVTRYRLRKKLQLEKGANLVNFMMSV
ncbi:MAG: tetratricopeptide repeat protein [Microscillaceae bacterium]|nr:tetratricopeptide repeat protein [Microscillaceae bacterium]